VGREWSTIFRRRSSNPEALKPAKRLSLDGWA
jgi:hypothetical protein